VKADLYISADVETDGPVPGLHPMLSFGLVGSFDETTFAAAGRRRAGVLRELRPSGTQVDARSLAISGLDRDRLLGRVPGAV
jgi:hypothetical protein